MSARTIQDAGPSLPTQPAGRHARVTLPAAGAASTWTWLNQIPTVVRRALVPILLIVLWQVGSKTGWWSDAVLPAPSSVAHEFWTLARTGQLGNNLWVSLRRVLIGAAIGISLGLILGTVSGLSKVGEEAIDATMQMLRTLPFLVMLPLLVLWFGIDERPKIVIIVIGTTFPMYLNSYSGVRGVDNKLTEMAATFGLSRVRRIFTVVLPAALPSILTGLRYSLGTGWLSLVVAEQINARSGLGYLISNAQSLFETNVLMVCVVIYAVLGLVSDLLVRALERRLLHWRGKAVTL